MLKFLIELVLLFIVIVILINHWDVVAAFFNAVIDWIVYWMKAVSAGPPEVPTP